MKILAIGRPKDPLLALSPSMMKQLLEPSIAAMKKQKAQGTVLASYYSPAKNCSITILNYDKAEEWMKDLMDIPIMTFYDQEIYPLVDMEDAAKEMIKTLKAAG
jgi:hypothetical protein